MSRLPKIAIVGRPNVGKSALFNSICKKRIAIVDEAEGITRDRLYWDTDLFGRPFRIIDTGGIDARSKADFNEEVKRQAEIAIEEADAIIMVVDVTIGITTLDEELAGMLLRTKKPVILAVNKVDNKKMESEMYQFMSLGISEMVAVSASHNNNIAEMCDAALNTIPQEVIEEEEVLGIKVAIVGRPNVGKSSLVNKFLDDNRCIVSPIAGTTRDSIDVSVTDGDDTYTLIDTAGIRRKGSEHEVVDKFAAIRTERAITRCEVCVLMLDSQEGLTTQEKKIAQHIEREGKGCIIVFNKWDLVKETRMEHCLRDIEERMPFLKHCPKIFMSTKTGRNLDKIFPLIQEVHAEWNKRVSTHKLNTVITEAMHAYHPPMLNGKRLRVYYLAQVDTCPPKFILFVNYPDLMTGSYQRYLYNKLRESYPFTGCPLQIHLKARQRQARGTKKRAPEPDLLSVGRAAPEQEMELASFPE